MAQAKFNGPLAQKLVVNHINNLTQSGRSSVYPYWSFKVNGKNWVFETKPDGEMHALTLDATYVELPDLDATRDMIDEFLMGLFDGLSDEEKRLVFAFTKEGKIIGCDGVNVYR